MTNWSYKVVVAIIVVEVSCGEYRQNGGSMVDVFGGGNNSRGGDYRVGVVKELGWGH